MCIIVLLKLCIKCVKRVNFITVEGKCVKCVKRVNCITGGEVKRGDPQNVKLFDF